MGILPWSIGLLSVLMLLFWAQSNRLTEDIFIQQLIKSNLHYESKQLFEKISHNASEKFRELSPPTDNEMKRAHPLTSRLHLRTLFMSKTNQTIQKELFLRLVNILYADLSIFDADPKINQPHIENLFTEALEYLSKPENKPRGKAAISLSKAQFEDPLQEVKRDRFFHILNGANGEILPNHPCKIPRLYDFFTTDKYKNGSYLAAPFISKYEVLLTLFDTKETASAIIQRRASIAKELQQDDSENKIEELTQQFEEQFSNHLLQGIEPKSIDFSIKKPSNRSN